MVHSAKGKAPQHVGPASSNEGPSKDGSSRYPELGTYQVLRKVSYNNYGPVSVTLCLQRSGEHSHAGPQEDVVVTLKKSDCTSRPTFKAVFETDTDAGQSEEGILEVKISSASPQSSRRQISWRVYRTSSHDREGYEWALNHDHLVVDVAYRVSRVVFQDKKGRGFSVYVYLEEPVGGMGYEARLEHITMCGTGSKPLIDALRSTDYNGDLEVKIIGTRLDRPTKSRTYKIAKALIDHDFPPHSHATDPKGGRLALNHQYLEDGYQCKITRFLHHGRRRKICVQLPLTESSKQYDVALHCPERDSEAGKEVHASWGDAHIGSPTIPPNRPLSVQGPLQSRSRPVTRDGSQNSAKAEPVAVLTPAPRTIRGTGPATLGPDSGSSQKAALPEGSLRRGRPREGPWINTNGKRRASRSIGAERPQTMRQSYWDAVLIKNENSVPASAKP